MLVANSRREIEQVADHGAKRATHQADRHFVRHCLKLGPQKLEPYQICKSTHVRSKITFIAPSVRARQHGGTTIVVSDSSMRSGPATASRTSSRFFTATFIVCVPKCAWRSDAVLNGVPRSRRNLTSGGGRSIVTFTRITSGTALGT